MITEEMKKFFSQLDSEKIKINWNKNPIRMELFLSFLRVETHVQTEFLGNCTGWTQYTGANDLIIGGGVVREVEYLDRLKYGKNLDNPYNNYVNPFYLFPIMSGDGKRFFLDYYSKEIETLKNKAQKQIEIAENNLSKAKEYKYALNNFWQSIEIEVAE
jgi:hypothetical protein